MLQATIFRRRLDIVAVFAFAIALLTSYSFAFSSAPFPSVDLPGHAILVARLREQLSHGTIWFYDPRWFAGWPAFQFYGFFPHLLAALLSIPLGLFAADSIQLSVHVIVCIGLASLPFSLLFTARPFAQEVLGEPPRAHSGSAAVLGVIVGTFTLWFLKHDAHRHGLGQNSIIGLGLFGQVIGWHFLLLYLGSLSRLLRQASRKYWLATITFYALLLISHPLTFVAGSVIGGTFIFLYDKNIRSAISAHFLGVGICGFWIVPLALLARQFTNSGITQPVEDPLQLLFTYPLGYLLAMSGKIDPSTVLLLGVCLIGLIHTGTKQSRLFSRFFCALLIAAILFTSRWTMASAGFGFHYLRFLGMLIVATLPILCAVPFVFLRSKPESQILSLLVILPFAVCSAVSLSFTSPSLKPIREVHAKRRYYNDEIKLQAYLKLLQPKGRLYVEFYSSPKKFPVFSQRFLDTTLYERAGFETLNGMTVQSAPSYHYTLLTAASLKAFTTAGKTHPSGRIQKHIHVDFPLIVSTPLQLTDRQAIEQLRTLGVTYAVVHTKQFLESLTPFALREPARIGPYFVIQIDQPHIDIAKTVEEPIIGYFDETGSLPFHLLSLYFFTQPELALSYSLIELDDLTALPKGLAAVIVNTTDSEALAQQHSSLNKATLLPIDIQNPLPYRFGRPRYRSQVNEDRYSAFLRYLKESKALAPLQSIRKRNQAKPAAALSWSEDFQTLRVSGLTPGAWYRIPYSYFPFWQVDSGRLYRGPAEHMYLLANSTDVELRYRPYRSREFLLGLLLSGISLVVLVWIFCRSSE